MAVRLGSKVVAETADPRFASQNLPSVLERGDYFLPEKTGPEQIVRRWVQRERKLERTQIWRWTLSFLSYSHDFGLTLPSQKRPLDGMNDHGK